jgi:hypothetical protein
MRLKLLLGYSSFFGMSISVFKYLSGWAEVLHDVPLAQINSLLAFDRTVFTHDRLTKIIIVAFTDGSFLARYLFCNKSTEMTVQDVPPETL